ncbi:hypothetical protein HK099_002349, partial [Clydaea vesicula]
MFKTLIAKPMIRIAKKPVPAVELLVLGSFTKSRRTIRTPAAPKKQSNYRKFDNIVAGFQTPSRKNIQNINISLKKDKNFLKIKSSKNRVRNFLFSNEDMTARK